VHQLPNRSFRDWILQLRQMLKACQQPELEQRLATFLREEMPAGDDGPGSPPEQVGNSDQPDGGGRTPPAPHFPNESDRRITLTRFDNPLFFSRIQAKLIQRILDALRQLEKRWGYFLPYRFSAIQSDEFLTRIRKLVREEDIKTAIGIGCVAGKGSTEAFLAGLLENELQPAIFCLAAPGHGAPNQDTARAGPANVKWLRVDPAAAPTPPEQLAAAVKRLRDECRLEAFDAVFVDGAAFAQASDSGGFLDELLRRSRVVILDDTSVLVNFENRQRMLADADFLAVADDPGLRDGYAMFRKCVSSAIVPRLASDQGRAV
jgi:hypothetical protein